MPEYVDLPSARRALIRAEEALVWASRSLFELEPHADGPLLGNAATLVGGLAQVVGDFRSMLDDASRGGDDG